MIAAVFRELNAPLSLEELGCLAPSVGQVRVKMISSGICGAQLAEIRGEKNPEAPRPRLMGHEGCGVVEEVGLGVTKVKAGDRVCCHWRKGSGIESAAPWYMGKEGNIPGGRIATFSQFALISENRLTPVPQDTPADLIALLGCGLSTALGVMENEAKLKAGESVLIVGCGGVGLNLVRVAKMMGAIVTGADKFEPWPEKGHMAIDAGANRAFTMEFLTVQPERYDVIVDTTGNADAISDALRLLAPSGRFIMVGQTAPEWGILIPNARKFFDGEGATIKFTQGGQFNPDVDLPRYIKMWRSGHLSIDGIITHRYPFAQINEALDAVRSGSAGRALLEMI